MVDKISISEQVKSKPAVMLYFKNDHCGPCKVLRPKVQALIETEFPKLELIVVDSVQNPALSGEFQVFANPTLLVFFDGKEYIRKSKYVSIGELETEISRLYAMMFE